MPNKCRSKDLRGGAFTIHQRDRERDRADIENFVRKKRKIEKALKS